MVGSHVAHDVVVGSRVRPRQRRRSSPGHAVVEDGVTFGGLSGVAQFVRVGEGAFVAAMTRLRARRAAVRGRAGQPRARAGRQRGRAPAARGAGGRASARCPGRCASCGCRGSPAPRRWRSSKAEADPCTCARWWRPSPCDSGAMTPRRSRRRRSGSLLFAEDVVERAVELVVGAHRHRAGGLLRLLHLRQPADALLHVAEGRDRAARRAGSSSSACLVILFTSYAAPIS